MVKIYKSSIFIFRRDFRLNDNTALIQALKDSNEVIPIFIFTPEQVTRNQYKSSNSVQFMIESLDDLDNDLKKKGSKLFYFYGKPHIVINNILKSINNVDAVYVNSDYSPYSKSRDNGIQKICDKYNALFNCSEDMLLNPVSSIVTGNGDVYQKFTPYFNKASKVKIRSVTKNNYTNYCSGRKIIEDQFNESTDKFYNFNELIAVNGGRTNALKKLTKINNFKKYNDTRNILSINTTKLSAYIKFGCVSIREVYYKFKEKLGSSNDLIKQLYWRDFFFNIMNDDQTIIEGNNRNFKKHYNKVPWIKYNSASDKQKKLWYAWTKGMTGYPVVDASMREMNTTGFMHNRGRLIVASFLTKLLMWDWEDGEKYFANKLVDYDVSNNHGGWTWSSGSGVDSQPYFRIFNPWTQSKKFDNDASYIMKWCPELSDVEPAHIHEWDLYYKEYENIRYPEPIIDYSKARNKSIKLYKKAI
jgi:deoxyribodipyrimidine photo-lyase